MRFVFDSTPLIYFAQLGILDKIAKLKGKKIIPYSVYVEVVELGKEKSKKDAVIVESFVKKRLFLMEKADDKVVQEFIRFHRLKMADAETLALAKEKNAIAIIDDLFLRTVAETSNMNYGGSVFILLKLCQEKIISKNEIKEYIDEMIKMGWRCSTEFYAAIMKEIEKL